MSLRRLVQVVLAHASLVGALASSAASQDLVLPPAADVNEANGAEAWLAGPYTARRQLIVDGAWLQSLVGRDLVGISVRRNQGSNEAMTAGQLEIEIGLAPAVWAPAQAAPVFSRNRQAPLTVVFSGRVTFPAAPPAAVTPAPWQAPYAVFIPFSTGFRYGGGPLVIETSTRPVSGGSAVNPWWALDAAIGAPTGDVLANGQGCLTGAHDPAAGAEIRTFQVGATAELWLRGLSAPQPVLCLLGGSDQSFAGMPLPLDLSPLTPPGCRLYNDVIVAIGVTSTPWRGGRGGLASLSLQLPSDPGLAGAVLFSQWLVPPAGGGGRFELSNGVRATVGVQPATPGVAWLEQTGPTGASRLLHDRCPVIRLHVAM